MGPKNGKNNTTNVQINLLELVNLFLRISIKANNGRSKKNPNITSCHGPIIPHNVNMVK